MAILLIDKIKQKNNGTFKLLDASDINWDVDLPGGALPDNIPTKTEMDTAISTAVNNAGHLKRLVLGTGENLPTTGDVNTIYMKPKGGSGDDVYDEYMFINSKWEKIGNSSVDLSNYVTKSDLSNAGTSTLSSAKSYTDQQVTAAKTAASTDATTKANQAVVDAKAYVDSEKAKYLPLAGGTLTGKLSGIITPTADTDAANKKYVDDLVEQTTPTGMLTSADFATGTTNGTFKVKDKEVAIKGLGSAAYVSTDSLAAKVDGTTLAKATDGTLSVASKGISGNQLKDTKFSAESGVADNTWVMTSVSNGGAEASLTYKYVMASVFSDYIKGKTAITWNTIA